MNNFNLTKEKNMPPYLENKHQKAKRILQEVIKMTLVESYLFTSEEVYSILVKKGFVEVNSEISNDAGELATRATELGLAQAKPEEKEEVKVMTGAAKFELGSVPEDFALPVANRGGARAPKYPFADMEVDQSFFVANADVKGDNALKTMTGACSKANKLFGIPSVDDDGEPIMRGTKNGETQATTFVKIFKAGPYTKGEGEDAVAGAMVVRTA